ncbi:MAG: RNA polymerase sigma factor [Planctomycetota bacterium]
MSETDLNALSKRVREGSMEALGEYLNAVKPRLLGLIHHLTGEHLQRVVESEDLFQEVARTAIASLSKIPREDLDVDAWLDRLARRRVVDAHREHFGAAKRSQGRNQIFSQMGSDDSESGSNFEQMLIASITSPSLAASRNFKLARLQEALAKLPVEHRDLLRLRYSEGLPTATIAEQMGKTDVAVRVMLSRIVAALQTLLGVEES